MPTTSRNGECCAPRRQRPRRFALEIDDDHVVLGHQHLTEVVVAVVTGFHGARMAPIRILEPTHDD
ncbi:MAG: hypothetical protein U1F59_12285 [Candidatus Competibacteraceae bacterium]